MEYQRTPAVLYSFPGSGNTWCRLLIEWSTGIYTGSFYDDRNLETILPGEKICGPSVSVIKAHPHLHSFQDLKNLKIPKKCNGLIGQFNKIVILLRDPFDAVFSEYQRRKSGGKHNRKIRKRFFEKHLLKDWLSVVTYLGQLYADMWISSYLPLMQDKTVSYLLLRYEDLLRHESRCQQLTTLLDFLNQHPVSSSMNCSFAMADQRSTHRKRPIKNNNKYFLSKKYVFFDHNLVCRLWNQFFRNFSEPFGYKPFGGFEC